MGNKTTVSDYVSLQRGITYKGKLVGEPGPALLGLGSIQPGGGFREGDYKTYGGECPENIMLSPGDLFASLKGATKDGEMIGSVAKLPESVETGRLTQDTVKLEFHDPNEQDRDFLYWVLRTPQYRAYCGGRATGSAVVALSRNDFLNFPVPAITPERLEVVELLETIHHKIELNRRMNATLEGMAQALFKSWFVDFDPMIDNALAAGNPIPDELAPRAEVRKKALESNQTSLSAEASAKAGFPAAFEFTEELGWIPVGWEIETVSDLCSTVTDGSHHSPKSIEKESGLPMASSKDLTDLGIDFESCRFISKDDFSELERNGCSPQIGDVLIAKDGARCGETCCIHVDDDPVVLLSSVAILRPKSPNLSTFLNTLMSRAETVADLRENYVSGSAIPRIILRDFKRFPVLTFPSSILENWTRHSRAIHQRAVESRNEGKMLSRLRDTLLPKLISGELETI